MLPDYCQHKEKHLCKKKKVENAKREFASNPAVYYLWKE